MDSLMQIPNGCSSLQIECRFCTEVTYDTETHLRPPKGPIEKLTSKTRIEQRVLAQGFLRRLNHQIKHI